MRIIYVIAALFFFSCLMPPQAEGQTFYFKRVNEPREKALSILVPTGWVIDGGAIRILSDQLAGANNMVDCKFDMAVKSDAAGKIMIRWLPEMMCIDQAKAWGNPEGAVFNNSLVRRKRPPQNFILEVAIPYAHPQATGVTVISARPLPALVAKYQQAVDPAVRAVTNMSYQACLLEYSYTENGIKFSERMVTVIEDYGYNGGGLWKNRETFLIRSPYGELAKWEPVLSVIQNSGIWSPEWITGEINNQRKRAGQVLATQQEIQAIDKAIADSRRNTYSEINKDMYLTLTGQNEYRNPFTGNIEVDNDSWKNRWVNAGGDVIYSNLQNYDPNHDPNLNVSGFKLSVPRQ